MKVLAGCVCLAAALLANIALAQSPKKPNILVIWGDDIGTLSFPAVIGHQR
jgi:hypothetical protein